MHLTVSLAVLRHSVEASVYLYFITSLVEALVGLEGRP